MFRIRQGLALGLVALVASLSSSQVQAQPVRVGVAFGNGGTRVGIGSGYYGPGYGPGYGHGYGHGYYGRGYGYGYPPPVIIAPQPVYVPPPVYVTQPQPQYAAPPTSIQDPGFPAPPSPIADGGQIVLSSSSSNVVDVRYTLNGHHFTMRPGTKQVFVNDRTWTIQFKNEFGQASTYVLHSGRYRFRSSASGIGLYETNDGPETVQPGLPSPPIPSPPEGPGPDFGSTTIPSRSPLSAP